MRSFAYKKVITGRKLLIDYEAPPICEGDFTSTGASMISLLPIIREVGPTGLVMEWTGSYYRLRWNTVFGALCYSIYRLSDELNPFSEYILVAECVNDTSFDLDVLGSGTYAVTAITPNGETELSSSIPTPPPELPIDDEGDCPTESGDPCLSGPTAFSVESRVDLSEYPGGKTIEPPPLDPLAPLIYEFGGVDSHNPILWDQWEYSPSGDWKGTGRPYTELPGDYPPGSYQLRYVSGFESDGAQGGCGAGQTRGGIAVYFVGDDEHLGYDPPEGRICNGISDVSLTLPPGVDVFHFTSGRLFCEYGGFPGLQAGATAWAYSTTIEKRWAADEEHSNTGGPLAAVWDPNLGPFDDPGDPYTPVLQLVQISGLIQQARKLKIEDWDAIKVLFDSDVANNWDGSLNNRNFYTATTLRWTDPSNAGFGGATLEYSQSHPTAANGCGWTLTIRKGATAVWVGHKNVGERADGVYYRTATSVGPDCLTVINKQIWDYPT